MNILFLDDRPQRIQWAEKEYARNLSGSANVLYMTQTVPETIHRLSQKPEWDLVSLDHDLNLEVFVDPMREDMGAEVARWIAKNKPVIKHIIVHSANHIAIPYMVQLLRDAGYDVEAKQAPA